MMAFRLPFWPCLIAFYTFHHLSPAFILTRIIQAAPSLIQVWVTRVDRLEALPESETIVR
jgi:hypothetical protein